MVQLTEEASRGSERLRFLAEAGLALVSSFDYATTLQQVAEMSLGLLCDYCIFDVILEDGTTRRVAWAHSNPKWPRLQEVGNFAPPTQAEKYPLYRVIKTGEPVFVPYVDEQWMREISWSEQHLNLMRELNACSAMFVPLTAHGSTVGAAIFAFSDSKRHHTEDDMRLSVELGRRAGLAVLHARQYEALRNNASTLRDMAAHQQVLIRELNHRVRNTLAIVQAIATQTFRPDRDLPAARESFAARISALADAHSLLVRDDWKGADIRGIVAESIKSYEQQAGERFRVSGEAAWVEARVSLALAMILHELATNATKYGALSNSQGVVHITWRVDREVGKLFLEWREEGGPEVVEPARRGFGSRLIESQLRSDLSGEAKIAYEKAGIVCKLTAALAEPRQRQDSL